MTEDRAVPGHAVVYLHVGTMKTGTTYLQQLMYANRDELAAAGLFLPGEHWAHQVRAVQDLLGLERWDRHIRGARSGAWQELADQVRAAPHRTSVISVEFLAGASTPQIRRAVASLAPVEVRVVFTVRDMRKVLPALWQTQVHNGARYSWRDFLRRVENPSRLPRLPLQPHRPEDAFAATQAVPAMLRRWASVVGADHVHVVTVPRRHRDQPELWRRFATLLGVDPDAAPRPPRTANPSIGYAATELLRRVNTHIGRLPHSEYAGTVKDPLVDALASTSQGEGRARLTRPAYDLAVQWNAEVRRTVRDLGIPVTGELADLPARPNQRVRERLPDDRPHLVRPRRMLRDAARVTRALARLRRRRARQLRRYGVTVEPPPPLDMAALRRGWRSAPDPVDAAAAEIAASAREAALLLRRLRRTGAGARHGHAVRQ
jgi:hypothetical protein